MKADGFSNMIMEFPFLISIIIESTLKVTVYLYILLKKFLQQQKLQALDVVKSSGFLHFLMWIYYRSSCCFCINAVMPWF